MEKGQIFLVSGLSGAGKTTLGRAFAEMLKKSGKKSYFLDGDDVRKFFEDKELSEEKRLEQGKRLAHSAKILSENGIEVVIGVTMGQHYLRDYMKSKINFIEVFLDADIQDCIKYDPRGFYKERMKLAQPLLRGVDLPFEKPLNPELVVYPYKETLEQSLLRIKDYLKQIGYL